MSSDETPNTVPACAGAQPRLASPLEAASPSRPQAIPQARIATAALPATRRRARTGGVATVELVQGAWLQRITKIREAKCGPTDECVRGPASSKSFADSAGMLQIGTHSRSGGNKCTC